MSRMQFVLPLLAVMLLGCKRSPESGEKPGLDRVTIATTTLAGSAPIFVAEEKGFFQAEGLQVDLRILPTGQFALVEMLDGRADFATVGDTPLARAVVEGKAVKIIASMSENNFANSIVARRDRGISKPEDLKGKKVGKVPWTTADFFLHVYLTTSYVDPHDVELVDVPATELIGQLLDGRVDAVSTWPPYATLAAESLGTNAVTLHDPDIYTMAWTVAIRPEWAKLAPESVKKFLRALARSTQYIRGHSDESRAIYARRAKLDTAASSAVWRGWVFAVSLDQSLILNLEDQARWILRQSNIHRSLPNFLDSVYADALSAVQPESVQIPGS